MTSSTDLDWPVGDAFRAFARPMTVIHNLLGRTGGRRDVSPTVASPQREDIHDQRATEDGFCGRVTAAPCSAQMIRPEC